MYIYILSCNTCKEVKPFHHSSKKNGTKRGYSHKCKVCHNRYVRETWYKKNGESQRSATKKYKKDNRYKVLASRYGTTEDVISNLFIKSDYACEVCKSEKDLCVDHCHNSGDVRGILCKSCNMSLGLLREDSERILSLAKYVEDKC